jgi:DNA-binding Xre family transcriptional regulator
MAGWKPASRKEDELMQWNLRLKAAELGIWKSAEMRRRLSDASLELSAGKMSALWAGTPTSIRLDDLDVICSVLACDPAALLICEPEKVAARRPRSERTANADKPLGRVAPRFGKPKSEPPL